jgi:hypothetical protein
LGAVKQEGKTDRNYLCPKDLRNLAAANQQAGQGRYRHHKPLPHALHPQYNDPSANKGYLLRIPDTFLAMAS